MAFLFLTYKCLLSMDERKGKPWNKVDYSTLRALAKDHTAREIAERLGRSPDSVNLKARSLNIKLKRVYRLTVPKPNAWSEEELEVLRKNAGIKTSIEIAKEIGRSRLAVKVMATRQGLSLQKNPWTDEQIDMLFELNAEGLHYKDIAVKIGRSEESVRAKITYYMLTKNRVWSDEEIETLLRMKSESKSISIIAKKLGRTVFSVRKKWTRLKKSLRDKE